MGQYYVIANIDKKQVIKPMDFDDGAKLMEFVCSSDGVLAGLGILLADGNGRGGGDLRSDNPIIGSWAGDRIVIAGDYADEGKFVESPNDTLYDVTKYSFENISSKVKAALKDDEG